MYAAPGTWLPVDLLVSHTMPIQGAVLEIACGTGHWTKIISGREDVVSVTALDASPEMIEIARGKAPDATFTCADIFNWVPDRAYDTVFFGFWLSHIPSARFKSFWGMVGAALKPGGTVCFLDSGHAAASTQVASAPGEVRRRHDGRAYRLVKTFHTPQELTEMLTGLGWDAEVTQQGPVVAGVARPQ